MEHLSAEGGPEGLEIVTAVLACEVIMQLHPISTGDTSMQQRDHSSLANGQFKPSTKLRTERLSRPEPIWLVWLLASRLASELKGKRTKGQQKKRTMLFQ